MSCAINTNKGRFFLSHIYRRHAAVNAKGMSSKEHKKEEQNAHKKPEKKKLVFPGDTRHLQVKPRASYFTPMKELKVGDPLSNITIFKDGKDPVLLPDDQYPPWIWDALIQPPPREYIEDFSIKNRRELRMMNHFRMHLNNGNKTGSRKLP